MDKNRERNLASTAAAILPATGGAAAAAAPSPNDGWADEARDERGAAIQGALIKFNEGGYHFSDGAPLEKGTTLVAVSIETYWVKWELGLPVEYVKQQSGRPARDELGDDAKDAWEDGPTGRPRDPWTRTKFIRLLDPRTLAEFTLSLSSAGGLRCASDLARAIEMARQVHPHAVPVVELSSTPWSRRFHKSRPHLKVIAWRTNPFAPDELPAELPRPPSSQPQIAHQAAASDHAEAAEAPWGEDEEDEEEDGIADEEAAERAPLRSRSQPEMTTVHRPAKSSRRRRL
jgi:hypothetical protein